MDKLLNHIETLLKWANQTPDHAKTFLHQAFGALQFYIIEHGLSASEYVDLETKWNTTYRPAFEAIMYGGDVNA
jgi:hypothetical protein